MLELKRLFRLFVFLAAITGGKSFATEFFVSKDGKDSNTGFSQDQAFLTIQRGVDELKPGDILTILPGEYQESVYREHIGSDEKETVIRAKIPGTVVLRGNSATPVFEKRKDHTYVYEASAPPPVQAVFEVDTLTRLDRQVSRAELDFTPGSYHYDAQTQKLYISTTDFRPASEHRYLVAADPEHGLYFNFATRVTIDGLSAIGFANENQGKFAPGHFATWGIILMEAKKCIIRNSVACLNDGGIGIRTGDGGGGNLIENCVAYGNVTPHSEEGGNIIIFSPRQDVIRNCLSYKSAKFGLRLYGTRKNATPADGSTIEDSIAWGNEGADIWVKGNGVADYALTKNTVAVSYGHALNMENVLIGIKNNYITAKDAPKNSVFLNDEAIVQNNEFADPLNFDFRLQSTSGLRGADGKPHRGPHAYLGNIYFVTQGGSDTADGKSLAQAWKTVTKALTVLKPGDTLYVSEGTYRVDQPLKLGVKDQPLISIRGRGADRVLIDGPVGIQDSHGLEFLRLNFLNKVTASNSGGLAFENCRFIGEAAGVNATGLQGIRLTHCEFIDSGKAALTLASSSNIYLRSNIFSSAGAVQINGALSDILYSGYNSYGGSEAVWVVNGESLSLSGLQGKGFDIYSDVQAPRYEKVAGFPVLQNSADFYAGPMGKRQGVDEPRFANNLYMTAPRVASTTATTANFEWALSRKAECLVSWGETPECENVVTQTALAGGDTLGTYSLTGLKPGTKYYFKISSLEFPTALLRYGKPTVVEPKFTAVSFTTAASDLPPRMLYVAPDGNDQNTGLARNQAWRTIGYAGAEARPGDTVLIAGGKYRELVRLRATGEKGRPIVFKSLPGERVVMDSDEKRMDRAFIVSGKNDVTIDGIYFESFRLGNWHGGVVEISRGRNVTVSRCLFDGRGYGYTSSFLSGGDCENLTISNCVFLNGIYGIDVSGSGMKIEHNVFGLNLIEATKIKATGPGNVFRDNIVTDSSPGKVGVWLHTWSGYKFIKDENNCYVLRVPDEERKLFWVMDFVEKGENLGHVRMGLGEYRKRVMETDSIVADPGFKALAKIPPSAAKEFGPDILVKYAGKENFSDFFATNPELIKRGIGLQPEAFADFSSPVAKQP